MIEGKLLKHHSDTLPNKYINENILLLYSLYAKEARHGSLMGEIRNICKALV
jgi:hypothetical protein